MINDDNLSENNNIGCFTDVVIESGRANDYIGEWRRSNYYT